MNYLLPFGPGVPRTQDFGNIQNNAVIRGGPHTGDDYDTPVGTPVRAAGDGIIDFAGTFDDSYADNYAWGTSMGGLVLWLNCGDDAPSFEYGHLSEVLVVPGDRVTRGQVIALTGNSGGSTGPHCHVGALPPGYVLEPPLYGRVNPRTYMTDYWDDSVLSYQGTTITTLTETDDTMAALSDEEQRELLGNTRTLIAMLNNVAGFLNESGVETRDNMRKATDKVVYGIDSSN